MDYAAALAYLDSHINNAATAGVEHELSIDSMVRLAAALGDPHTAYPVIHVTGTNGKGSTARMISSLLMAHGLTVGLYTSPHLEKYNERFQINLEPVDDENFVELLSEIERLEETALPEPPTHFDILTGMAFSWFAQNAVDVAVVEVGLLGRWDATNIVTADVAVITNIGLDHTDGTGDWKARVAREKAGIIKSTSQVVVGETDPALTPIFAAEAAEGHWFRGADFDCTDNQLAVGGRVIDVRTPFGNHEQVYVPLHGRHQGDNAALAVVAAEAFFGRAIDPEVAAEALGTATAPGRFEVIGRDPLLILDGAHNEDGVRAASQVLAEEFQEAGDRILVTGMLIRRDTHAMLKGLGADSAKLVVTTTPPTPRGIPAAELAEHAREIGAKAVMAIDDIDEAVDHARLASMPGDLILIAGSLYVTGDARRVIMADR